MAQKRIVLRFSFRLLKRRRLEKIVNKKDFIEVDEKMCEEVNNCFGVKIVDGKKYCRGCGNVQPEGVPVAGITSEINICERR